MAVEKRHLTRDMTSRLRLRPSAQARALQRRAHEQIPGGAHTYAKGDGRALDVDARALVDGQEDHLVGPPTKSVYRRYN